MRFLFSPYGRTNRVGFWLFTGIYVLLSVVAQQIDKLAGTYSAELDLGVADAIVGLFLIWPSIAVSVRRFHDIAMSGWWVLWFTLLTCVGAVVGAFVAFAFFGADPNNFIVVDETTPLQEYPSVFWAIMGGAAVPCLIELYLLGFKRGKDGQNRFDGGVITHENELPPPWA